MTEFLTTLATVALVVIVFTLIVELFNFIYALTKLAEEFATSLRSRTMNDKQAAALISRADTLLCRLLEGTKNFEQLVADLRFYFSELERERLHHAANRNKTPVPPDIAEAIAKEYADLDRQAKLEPCPPKNPNPGKIKP